LVTSAGERAELGRLARLDDTVHWATVMFSAKESVYKAWFPLTRQWLGFQDASVTIDASASTFTAKLLLSDSQHSDPPPVRHFAGRWRVGFELIVTATVVPPLVGSDA
jgi:4'-phosphopantetheinyl transferase EntD